MPDARPSARSRGDLPGQAPDPTGPSPTPSSPAAAGDDLAQPTAEDRVRESLARWRSELEAVGRPHPLLQLSERSELVLDVTRAHPSGLAQLLAGRSTRLSGLFRESAALSHARARAREIRLADGELADAHGIDACRLAVGVVAARAPGAGGPDSVVAPVLLRRARLVPQGPGHSDDDLELGADLVANPALVRWLRGAGIDVDGDELVERARGRHGLDPQPVLDLLRDRAGHLRGLSVQPRLVVGLFADLVPDLLAGLDRVASDGSLPDVVAALAGDDDARGRLGADLEPGAGGVMVGASPAVLPLDPDARRVFEAVLAGRSVRVEAPPGTGATQLAAAVLAAQVALGRRAVLVCPQRYELEAVAARLGSAGLPDVLRLTAPPVGPGPASGPSGAPSGEDAPATDAGARDEGPGRPAPPTFPAVAPAGAEPADPRVMDGAALLELRHRLLHDDQPRWGVSLVGALRAVAALATTDPAPATSTRMPTEAAARMVGRRDEVASALVEAARLGAFERDRPAGPWTGARLRDPEHADEVAAAVRRLVDEGVDRFRRETARVADASGLAVAQTVEAAAAQVDLLVRVRNTLDVLTRDVFERYVPELVAATASADWRREHGVAMGLLERRRWVKQAETLVRPGGRVPDLHAALVAAAEQRERWQQLGGGGGWPQVPTGLADVDAAVRALRADLEVLEPVLAGTEEGGGLTRVPLGPLQVRLQRLAAGLRSLPDAGREAAVVAGLRQDGLADLLDDLRRRRVGPDAVTAELELCWWRTVLGSLLGEDGARTAASLSTAGLLAAVRAVEASGDMDRAAARDAVARALAAGAPTALARSPYQGGGEAGAGDGRAVDLVVLLGAHAVPTAEAVTALGLGRQALVVGDPGGLPPVRPRLVPEAAAPAGDAAGPGPGSHGGPGAGVLADTAGVLPTVALGWQHRMPAQVAGVAAAVTAAVTAGGGPERSGSGPAGPALASGTVAVPGAGGPLVRLDHVLEGSAVPGGDGVVESVDTEVARVVGLVVDHALSRPQESLAVVALTRRHARRIADELRAVLPDYPRASRALRSTAGRGEGFLVTDAARAGAAVRDHVVLATGFGRTPHGRVLPRFGPLDEPGGERLVAHATGRARRRLTVVSCLSAGDVDVDPRRRPGAAALRRLLEAAEPPPAAGAVDAPATEPAAVDPSDAAPAHGTPPGSGPAASGGGEPQRDAAGEQPDEQGQDHAPRGDVLLDDLAVRLRRRGALVERRSGPGEPDLAVALPPPAGARPDPRAQALRTPDVAVVTDLLPPPAGLGVVERHVAVPAQLARQGWRVEHVAAVDLFGDPEAVATRVLGESDRGPAGPGPGARGSGPAAQRPDPPVLPDRSDDDSDAGWGERQDDADRHWHDERPPHWRE